MYEKPHRENTCTNYTHEAFLLVLISIELTKIGSQAYGLSNIAASQDCCLHSYLTNQIIIGFQDASESTAMLDVVAK